MEGSMSERSVLRNREGDSKSTTNDIKNGHKKHQPYEQQENDSLTTQQTFCNYAVFTLACVVCYVLINNHIETGYIFRIIDLHKTRPPDYGYLIICTIGMLACCVVFHLTAFVTEKCLLKKSITESTGVALYCMTMILTFVFPVAVFHCVIDVCAVLKIELMAAYCYTFMKLLSYYQVNRRCREAWKKNEVFEDYHRRSSVNDPSESTPNVRYPDNLTISNILSWVYLPTYYYRLHIPEDGKIRWKAILKQLLFICIGSETILNIMHYCVQPQLKYYDFELGFFAFRDADHMIKHYAYALLIMLPITSINLLLVYCYLFCVLKIVAELIGYDSNQEFCSDWWNSEDLRVYWKKWNYPVYDWMFRSIYIPVKRMGLGDLGSQLSVFLVSGLLHDYVVYGVTGIVSLWVTFSFILHTPIILFSVWVKKNMGKSWANLMVGLMWPIQAILGFTYAYKLKIDYL